MRIVFKLTILAALFLPVSVARAEEKSPYYFKISDLEAVLEEELAEYGAGDNIQLEYLRINTPSRSFLLSELPELRARGELGYLDKTIFSVADMDVRKNNRRFDAVLHLPRGDKNQVIEGGAIEVKGNYDLVVEVPILSKRLYRGDLIKNNDIEWAEVLEKKIKSDTITERDGLVGKVLKRRISAGRPLRERDISMPRIIDKGNLVQMVYRKSNIELKTNGRAMDDGVVGEIIRVKNERSGKIIYARVEKNGEVTVGYKDTSFGSLFLQSTMEERPSKDSRNEG